MEDLLLEIRTEEIPAGYIEPALAFMEKDLLARLDRARIEHGGAKVYGTPRRLAVIVEKVSPHQRPETTELVGPPVKVAFDDYGKPRVPAVKFAEKAGVPVEKLAVKETGKGEYLTAEVTDPGEKTPKVLEAELPALVTKIPFPKSMRWAIYPTPFARPITGIAALYGKKSLSFAINNVKSKKRTAGHFFMAPKETGLDHPSDYLKTLKNLHVVADIAKRKKMVAEGVRKEAAERGGTPIQDAGLLDTVTNLVELPVPVSGGFEDSFLSVPREVLITAMAKHQKYFAVEDEKGNLLPAFVAVNNTRVKNPRLSAQGHERVLRARLEDARFFFEADKKQSFEEWNERLSGILFQARLGTVADKVARVKALAAFVAEKAFPGDSKVAEKSIRAAALCKADLVSQVVVEFPTLQGVMGRVYAGIFGEDKDVAAAIEEHYRPTHAGGALPETDPGAVAAIADKMDSLCGCFAAGLLPTGASDPYALRRQSIGVIHILLERKMALSVSGVVRAGLDRVYEDLARKEAKGKKKDLPPEEAYEKLLAFIRDRMAHVLAEEGISRDAIAAASAVSFDIAPDLQRRAAALDALKQKPDFDTLAVAFKRVVNIMNQAREKNEPVAQSGPDEELFEKPAEGKLTDAVREVAAKSGALLDQGRVEDALEAVATLKEPVDLFFDEVMVMAEDPAVRKNRLAVLGLVADVFSRFADFSKINA